MAQFPELRSLRLHLDDPPRTLHLAECLSALTALTLLEIVEAFPATIYSPIFRASSCTSRQWTLTQLPAHNMQQCCPLHMCAPACTAGSDAFQRLSA